MTTPLIKVNDELVSFSTTSILFSPKEMADIDESLVGILALYRLQGDEIVEWIYWGYGNISEQFITIAESKFIPPSAPTHFNYILNPANPQELLRKLKKMFPPKRE